MDGFERHGHGEAILDLGWLKDLGALGSLAANAAAANRGVNPKPQDPKP